VGPLYDRPVSGRTAVRAALIGLAVAVALSTPAGARDLGKKIGQGSASGEFAVAVAEGAAMKPANLFAKVQVSPPQYVDAAYTVVCTKGQGTGTADEIFGGDAPLVERLRHPFKHPDRCAVSAEVQLSESGELTLKLFARR
jgi:hypothetical protein